MKGATARARVLAICEHLIRDGVVPNVMLVRDIVKLRKTTVAAIFSDLIESDELQIADEPPAEFPQEKRTRQCLLSEAHADEVNEQIAMVRAEKELKQFGAHRCTVPEVRVAKR